MVNCQALSCFLLVVMIEFHIAQSQSYPPLPHLKSKGKTFYIETYFKANWYRASEFCRYHGMQLASISNKKENDLLVEAVKSLALPKDRNFWVSGNDLAQWGSYVWAGNGQRFTFQNFYTGKPDHVVGANGEVERCVELRGEYGYQWNDLPCSISIYFICEKENKDD